MSPPASASGARSPLPDRGSPEFRDCSILSHDWDVLREGLRREQTVERVAVRGRQSGCQECVDAAEFQILGADPTEMPPETFGDDRSCAELAKVVLASDFIRGYGRDENCRVELGKECPRSLPKLKSLKRRMRTDSQTQLPNFSSQVLRRKLCIKLDGGADHVDR